MKKCLLVTLVGAVLLSGCSSDLSSPKNRTFSKYSELEAYFDSYTDINRGENGYKLFMKRELPIDSEATLKFEAEIAAIEKTMVEFNPNNASYYKDLFTKERKEIREMLSGERFLEEYIRILEHGDRPMVDIYERFVLDYKNRTTVIDSGKSMTRVKFDCKKSGSDMMIFSYSKLFVNAEQGRTMTISEISRPVNINGGAKVEIRYYFPNDKYLDYVTYYSKEQANASEPIFDKAKQISCGFD